MTGKHQPDLVADEVIALVQSTRSLGLSRA